MKQIALRTRMTGLLSGGFLALALTNVFADETWSSNNLTISGSTDPATTYVKQMKNEQLSAGWIKLGTEVGSAALVAEDSTITLNNPFYVGYEVSPGYADLTAKLYLTNSTLTCTTLYLGYGVAGATGTANGQERVWVELGPGGLIQANTVVRYSKPYGRIRFAGGRIGFPSGTSDLFLVQGWSWKGEWPNNGYTLEGQDAPIDIEVTGTRRLIAGWAQRSVSLVGNGGFVKRGAGTLVWGWHTTGSNDGNVNGTATYTGDTEIREGGIRLATPSTEAKRQIRYSIPTASPLKISEGAFFDLAGNSAAWVSVSGAGMVTNSTENACALTVGTGNVDCTYAPAVAGGTFDVIKVGAGLLTLGSTSVTGTLRVDAGTVKATPGAVIRLARLSVAPGLTVDLRGAQVTVGAFDLSRGANVLTDKGLADIVETVNEDTRRVAGTLAVYDSFTKAGSGALTLVGPCPKVGGTVAVAAGKVVCEPATTYPGRYYRINYTKSATTKTEGLQFAEFSLYGVGGGRINQGTFSYNPITGTPTLKFGGYDGIADARTLAVREVAVWMPNHSGYFQYSNSHDPTKMFDGDLETWSENTYYWDASNMIVFRLEDDVQPALGFTFTTSKFPVYRPTEWKIEGSEDGETWVTLAQRAYGNDTDASWEARTNSTPNTAKTEYNGGLPYLFDSLVQTPYSVFGTAAVSVAPGATLEIQSPMGQLSRLSVDCDVGAGTITSFSPAENGVIELVSTSRTVEPNMVLPLTISSASNIAALRTWKVRVNGEEKSTLRVRFINGRLTIVGNGLILVFR